MTGFQKGAKVADQELAPHFGRDTPQTEGFAERPEFELGFAETEQLAGGLDTDDGIVIEVDKGISHVTGGAQEISGVFAKRGILTGLLARL